jgi:hypothetical protein
MARPARVDMRCRNPWFFARLRLFGWKVRFTSFLLAEARRAQRAHQRPPGYSTVPPVPHPEIAFRFVPDGANDPLRRECDPVLRSALVALPTFPARERGPDGRPAPRHSWGLPVGEERDLSSSTGVDGAVDLAGQSGLRRRAGGP